MPYGIIPAYAGNTGWLFDGLSVRRDHPRVCGEHVYYDCEWFVGSGSSPRMRGTPTVCSDGLRGMGIIPAYAGNTSIKVVTQTVTGDHPRVCGEHRFQ